MSEDENDRVERDFDANDDSDNEIGYHNQSDEYCDKNIPLIVNKGCTEYKEKRCVCYCRNKNDDDDKEHPTDCVKCREYLSIIRKLKAKVSVNAIRENLLYMDIANQNNELRQYVFETADTRSFPNINSVLMRATFFSPFCFFDQLARWLVRFFFFIFLHFSLRPPAISTIGVCRFGLFYKRLTFYAITFLTTPHQFFLTLPPPPVFWFGERTLCADVCVQLSPPQFFLCLLVLWRGGGRGGGRYVGPNTYTAFFI